MESMKMIDDNSFYDNHILNLQKIKRAKEIFDDPLNNNYKIIEFKSKNLREEKNNKEKNPEYSNIYADNQIYYNRQPSPFLGTNNNLNLLNSNNRRNEKHIKENFGSEIFNEKFKKLISKKKK